MRATALTMVSNRELLRFWFACGGLLVTTVFGGTVLAGEGISNPGSAPRVVLNEVLANEPGSSITLEWIELYNPSGGTNTLDGMYLVVGKDTTFFPQGVAIGGNGYAIVSRKPISSPPGSASFEQRWGNNSGIWGDAPEENYPLIEGKFSLKNSGDTVRLSDGIADEVFVWFRDAGDGISWERVSAQDTVWYPCIDYSGSTPGQINSQTPRHNDLALFLNPPVSGQLFSDRGRYTIQAEVKNVGTGISALNRIVGYDDRDFDGVLTSGESLFALSIPALEPGLSRWVSDTVSLWRGVHRIWCVLDPDDRLANNRAFVDLIVGEYLPPMVLNEFLADPTSITGTEWIELFNRSANETVSILNWKIADASGTTGIIDQDLSIRPGSYLILAENPDQFQAVYAQVSAPVVALSNWVTLNNTGDKIVLINDHNIAVDSFAYSQVWGGNVAWERVNPNLAGGAIGGVSENWWRCVAPTGSTPGELNSLAGGFSQTIQLQVTPNHFSPDGDGFDDEVTIAFSMPFASSLTLKVFDVRGRLVKTLLDRQPQANGKITWDGRGDNGQRLRVGIYLLYAIAEGEQSGVKKTTVVIVRNAE